MGLSVKGTVSDDRGTTFTHAVQTDKSASNNEFQSSSRDSPSHDSLRTQWLSCAPTLTSACTVLERVL